VQGLLPTILAVWGGALVYLLVDVYPTVKSFRATLSTLPFWLFWIVFSVLSTVAFAVLRLTAGEKINVLGPGFANLAVILLTVLGTVGILQSFTIKFADYRFIDLGALVEGFRRQVLADISAVSATQKQHRALAVADQVFQRYKSRPNALRDEYAGVMSFANRSLAEIGHELDQLMAEANAANLSFELTLARRIAQADIKRAEQLLNARPS